VTAACLASPSAHAAKPAARALVDRYAPVVRLAQEKDSCGYGVNYPPTDVDAILGNPDVALRGPWSGAGPVEVGPSAHDLGRGLFSYYLDFPGNALSPGCSYDEWSRLLNSGHRPVTYARLAKDPSRPGQLALQYWFFYVYNDFNDKHEGDWELIQLDFPARTAGAAALAAQPSVVGYSQHGGAESAAWGSPKLTLVGGTHPVVYPAIGSHANYFQPALYLGRSGREGVGCDDTSGQTAQLRPTTVLVPTQRSAYLQAFPWLGYEGHWGERHWGFFDGPTGPNTKDAWTEPIAWASTWRDASYTVPAGQSLGHSATGFFCGAVAVGSALLTSAVQHPSPLLVALVLIVLVLAWLASRTSWQPSAPLRVHRRRPWGAIVTASGRMFGAHPRTFLAIGLLFIPLGALISLVQHLLFHASGIDALVAAAGRTNAFADSLAVGLGILLTLFGLAVVHSATAAAMKAIDAGEQPSAVQAYRQALPRLRALLLVVLVPAAVVVALDVTGIGIVVALWLAVRWSVAAQVVSLEGCDAVAALRRSGRIVSGSWWRAASLIAFVTGVALLLGPLVGTALLFATSLSFDLVNLISGLVYVVVLPFSAIATTYLYFDLSIAERRRVAAGEREAVLPAEVT
jgi:hypothetical protein